MRCTPIVAILSVVCVVCGAQGPVSDGNGGVVEIARGHSWVSPYWGYSTPKIVCDGKSYFTAGLWGAKPEGAEGVIYKCDGAAWREGARLPGIYQPATLLLDRQGRLIVLYTRQLKPVRILRSKTPGDVAEFDELPAPPDMPNAYYIGVTIRNERLFIAYLVNEIYTMYLACMDLGTLAWTPSIVVQEGQVAHKPKTAWTYPILYPTKSGLHFAASNSPDGGEGNTYNEVWYLFYPWMNDLRSWKSLTPTIRERVADCPMGHLAYAMDMVVEDPGDVHIVYMWNHRAYGDPLPEGSAPEGTYHARRDPKTGAWRSDRMGNWALAGLFADPKGVIAVTQSKGALVRSRWQGPEKGWQELPVLCDAGRIPAGPGFMDILSPASGSDLRNGLAVVTDGLLPEEKDAPRQRIVWSLLPETPVSTK